MRNFNKNFLILFTIFALPIPCLFWLPKGEVLAHGLIYPWPDASILWEFAISHLFNWVKIIGLGTPASETSGFLNLTYNALFVAIAGSNHVGQVLFFYVGFVCCISGMFILARSLGFSLIASLIAGMFYVLNPIVMSGMPIEIVNLRVLPYYVATPILLSLVVRVMRSRSNKQDLTLFAIASIFLGSAGYSSLQYFVLNLIIIGSYIVFAISMEWQDRKNRIELIFKSIALLIVMFLTNFYWLSPLLFDLSGSYMVRLEPGFSDVDILRGLSVKLVNGFRMLPYSEQSNISPWLNYYYTPLMIMITFGLVIIAGFAFLSSKTRRNALFLGLLLLIILFLASGIREPFNVFGKIIFLCHPYVTRLFRNPFYFETLMPLTLALLIGLAIGEIIQIASTKSRKYLTLTVIAVTTLLAIYGWQFIIGGPVKSQLRNGPSQTIKVPLYYKELTQFFRSNPKDFRIVSIPTFTLQDMFVAYRWGKLFFGIPPLSVWSGKPVFRPLYFGSNGVNPLFELVMHPSKNIISQDAWRALLQITNVRYVTFHRDTDWKYLVNKQELKINRDEIYGFVKRSPYLNWIRDFGAIELYEFNSDLFLPHFYIPQNIIYSPNDIEVLPEIVRLPEYELRSGIYLGSEINRNKAEIDGNMSPSETKYAVSPRNKEILEMADEVVAEAKLESQIDEEYFEKLETFKNGVPFPYVRWQPGSWEWKLARIKEKYEEWRVRKNPEKLIEKKLFYAGKRISELDKFADNADKNTLIMLIAEGYQSKMNEVIEEIEKLRNWEIEKFEEQVIKIRAYWERHKEEIEKLRNWEIEKLRNWENVFEELDGKIKTLEKPFDLRNLEYRVDIPQKGNYSLFIKEINELTNLEIDGDKVEINGNKFGTNEKWTELGERELEEGKHKITLKLPEFENLVGENWQKLQEEATESGEIRLVSQGFFPKGENVVFQPIRDWEGGKLYYLSFEYKTKGGSLGVSVLEDRLDINEINGLTDYKTKTEKILEKKLRNWETGKFGNWENEKLGNWEKFERILKADENAQGAKIYFYTLPEPDAFAEVRFRNVKIYKIEQPKIVLRTIADNTGKKTWITPRITFVKINPTKYRIKVEGAKEPYTLVFSESFHKGWKIYVSQSETKHNRNTIETDRNKPPSEAKYGEIVASYFDGDIKEGTHRNTFLEKATFETWGKKPIAEDRHYLVNGYANSWYITPEDAGGKENYELIVEFWPQRLFYVGLFISLTTVISCLGYLGWGKLRN